MGENQCESYTGLLTLDLLFKSSKSERVHPVLHTEDGRSFRLYFKEKGQSHDETLASHVGNEVTVLGVADDLRGHWRIVVHGGPPVALVRVVSPTPPPTNPPEE